MSDENKKDPRKGGEFRVPPRTWILWIAILGAIPLLLLFKDPRDNKERISQSRFLELFQSHAIKDGIIWFNVQDPLLQDITGHYAVGKDNTLVKFATTI